MGVPPAGRSTERSSRQGGGAIALRLNHERRGPRRRGAMAGAPRLDWKPPAAAARWPSCSLQIVEGAHLTFDIGWALVGRDEEDGVMRGQRPMEDGAMASSDRSLFDRPAHPSRARLLDPTCASIRPARARARAGSPSPRSSSLAPPQDRPMGDARGTARTARTALEAPAMALRRQRAPPRGRSGARTGASSTPASLAGRPGPRPRSRRRWAGGNGSDNAPVKSLLRSRTSRARPPPPPRHPPPGRAGPGTAGPGTAEPGTARPARTARGPLTTPIARARRRAVVHQPQWSARQPHRVSQSQSRSRRV